MRLKTYKMAVSILPKFLNLKWNISRTIWRIEVCNGSFFAFFTLFHLSLTFFRPDVPFKREKNVIVLSRLKNISYPQIRKLLILSYFIKNFPTHFSFCKSVILCRCSKVKPLIDAGHTGPNSQLNICENSSFTT